MSIAWNICHYYLQIFVDMTSKTMYSDKSHTTKLNTF
jgi:hypothetical protein